MMAGLAIENTETIILDSNNSRCKGPEKLFEIVIDEFDGTTISAWHIEDKYGETSRNLGSNKCKSLDAIVGRVGMFTYEDAVKQLNWTKPKYVNKLVRENQNLKAELDKLRSK